MKQTPMQELIELELALRVKIIEQYGYKIDGKFADEILDNLTELEDNIKSKVEQMVIDAFTDGCYAYDKAVNCNAEQYFKDTYEVKQLSETELIALEKTIKK